MFERLLSRLSIRATAPVLLALPVLLAAGMLIAIGTVQSRKAVEPLASQQLAQIHLQIKQYVDSLVGVPARVDQANIALLESGRFDPAAPRDWASVLVEQFRAFEVLSAITWGGEDGQCTWVARYVGDDEHLYYAIKDGETGDEIVEYRVDLEGRIASEPAGAFAFDPRTRPWYVAPKTAGGPAWSEPFLWVGGSDEEQATLGIAFGWPWYDDDGSLIGVIDADLSLQDISRFLSDLQIGRTGRAYLVDEQGLMLASSTGASMADAGGARLHARDSDARWIRASADHLTETFGAIANLADDHEEIVEIDGEREWLRASPFTHPTGLQWAIVTVVPDSDFMSEVMAGRRRSAWFAAGVTLGTLGLGVLLAMLLVRPMLQLSQHVRRLGEGELDREVHLGYGRELVRLSDDINHMASDLRAEIETREQAERELRAHRDHLEDEVRARTVDLDLAREEAEAANRAKSEFLSNMSHELRTPLNGVLGYAQILLRDPSVSTRQRDSLGAIESCGQHLLTLISDVLDLSKIEAGRLEIELEPCDLQKLLTSVFDITRPRGQTKGLDVRLDVAPTVPRGIITDATKLRQTVINLMGNAVKFTDEGEVVLQVTAEDDVLVIRVIDSGIGMTPEEAAEVFDPFKQAEGGKTAGGTGLGLPISKRIVEELGGRLDIESEKGRGSTFIIRLPFEEADEAVAGLDEATLSDGRHWVLEDGQDVTLLIVDDLETNRLVLMHLLEDAGFRTLQADNGEQAVSMVREHRCPLVLMDIRMPVLDGFEATKIIRTDPQLRDTKVIAVTASVFADSRDKIDEAGFNDMIGKPFRASELFTMIAQLLELRFTDAQATAATDDDGGDDVKLSPELVAEFGPRLAEATKLRSVSALNELAKELESHPDPAAVQLGVKIGGLVAGFDFNGLKTLADELA